MLLALSGIATTVTLPVFPLAEDVPAALVVAADVAAAPAAEVVAAPLAPLEPELLFTTVQFKPAPLEVPEVELPVPVVPAAEVVAAEVVAVAPVELPEVPPEALKVLAGHWKEII
jgi:hypothetical protein